MKTLTVKLATRSYPIFIGTDLLSKTDLARNFIKGTQVLIITNETIAPLYLEKTRQLFNDFELQVCILKDGEQYKTTETINQIYTILLENRFDRKCTLVALGGGVVGDMTGFAAATYQRGVNFIQIPTTLLSQVDSSVGGKTGVNHLLGKNMIGAFYQPQCVIADLSTLHTLDDRQIYAGLAEIIKYGLINDAQFFEWLEQNIKDLLALDEQALNYAIFKSCENKANIVAEDEYESGVRATLNLGHTFGHAIETHQGYGNWLHGEAVGAGIVLASKLSHHLGWLSSDKLNRIISLIKKTNLPIIPPNNMSGADFISIMSVDKKVIAGRLKLILLKDIGQAIISTDFNPDKLTKTLPN